MMFLKFGLLSAVVAAVAFFLTPTALAKYFAFRARPSWAIRQRFNLWKPLRWIILFGALLASNLVFILTGGTFAGPILLCLAMAVVVFLDVRQLDAITNDLENIESD